MTLQCGWGCVDGASIALRTSRPVVPGIEILEVVFRGVRWADLKFENAATHPATPFGQLIAETFAWQSPREWA